MFSKNSALFPLWSSNTFICIPIKHIDTIALFIDVTYTSGNEV